MSLVPPGYRPRLLDSVIARYVAAFGGLEIEGAKFCGKTWAALAHAQSIIHLDDDRVCQAVELDVSLALAGEQPHLIDEWQDVPRVWDAVRRAIDASGNRRGQFLLTGSSAVDLGAISHSGAGRIARMRLRPMSLYELGASSGSVSLLGLFEGDFSSGPVSVGSLELARLACTGGWPASLDAPEAAARDLPFQYLAALFDISSLKRGLDSSMARHAAFSLARNLGRPVTYKTLYTDMFQESPGPTVDASACRKAVEPYLSFFRDQYFMEELPGWDAPVKAKSRVHTKPKRGLVDPSLSAALLGMSPERLAMDTQTFGTIFEELCLRDVRVYVSALGVMPEPLVSYYSDADGLEVDIVIELPDGRWGAFEVKLGEAKVSQAEASLLRLKNKVAANPTARNPEPSFLAVLVGVAPFARRLPSGVYVVPITTLGA